MAKKQPDHARAKSEKGAKYAPNWGRLHLKWGEALGYAGRKEDARAHYRIASTLVLSVAAKPELTKDLKA